MGNQKTDLVNAWDQVKAYGGDRFIIYWESRSLHVANLINGWRNPTNPKGPYYEHGNKCFYAVGEPPRPGDTYHTRMMRLMQKAVKWIEKMYGRKLEFVRNKRGEYVERVVNEKFPLPVQHRKPKVAAQSNQGLFQR